MMKIPAVSLVVCLLLAGGYCERASGAQGDIVLLPKVDTTLASGSAVNTNYGAAYALTIKTGALSNGTTFRGFLTFDAGAARRTKFLSAALDLEVNKAASSTATIDIYGIMDSVPDSHLLESEVTWNSVTANLNRNTSPIDMTKAVNLGSVSCSSSCSKFSLVTQQLLDFVNSDTDGLMSFILVARDKEVNHTLLYPKENPKGKPPSLTLIPASIVSSLAPKADASVTLGSAEKFGTLSEIAIVNKGASAGAEKVGYLGFELGTAKMGYPSFSDVSLEITPSTLSSAGSFELYGIANSVAGQDFGDLQINGLNAPSQAGASLLATFNVSPGAGVVAISTPRLLDFLNGNADGRLNFYIRSKKQDGIKRSFYSKEYKSQIVDGYTAVGPHAPVLKLQPTAPTVSINADRTEISITGARANTLYHTYSSRTSNFVPSNLNMAASASVGAPSKKGVITNADGEAMIKVSAVPPGQIFFRAQEMPLYVTSGGADASMRDLIDSGVVDPGNASFAGPVPGTKMNINNTLIEYGMGDSIPNMMSNIRLHTENNSSISRQDFKKWTRWYQEDERTQIFRLFTGDQNVRSGLGKQATAGRIEAFTNATLASDAGLDSWLNWEGTFTFIKPGGNNFQLLYDIPGDIGWPLHLDSDNSGKFFVLHRRGSPEKEQIAVNVTGKSIAIKVRTNGDTYIVYRKIIGVDDDFVFVTQRNGPFPKSESRNLSFRWGIYRGSVQGSSVSTDGVIAVTGAKVYAD